MLISLRNRNPKITSTNFIAPGAYVIGDVRLGEQSSVFFGAVLRGDILPIRVGSRTNIQEHALVHTSHNRTPALIGDEVTIGHRAIIHGASIGNRCLIGMGSIILDEAEVGEECVVGAGTLITEGKKFPPRSMILGSPGKVVRELTEKEIVFLPRSAENYVILAADYLKQLVNSNVP
jgi:carbonic anhydrase/acetyltransferase-like protein (isoleucine patch superfamily)